MSNPPCRPNRPDEQLAALVAGVVDRVGADPPEVQERLRSPGLRAIKGPPGLNSYSVRKPDGTKAIILGGDLYPFLLHYTRAAATHFLPTKPGGRRPSPFWHQARSAVATILDKLASPAPAPVYPKFNLTPRQSAIAAAFADCAYRFALCHELAHVALGHLDDPSLLERRRLGDENLKSLQLSQNLEIEADIFGLELQYRSLPEELGAVPGLVSAVYFLRATALAIDTRLVLLGSLVDEYEWKISRTHPPVLGRLLPLISKAGSLCDHARDGLHEVHSALTAIDMQILETANNQQEAVVKKIENLITADLVYSAKRAPDKSRDHSLMNDGSLPDIPRPKSITGLLEQFAKSAVGVLQALEPSDPDSEPERLNLAEAQLRSLLKDRFALALPQEFQRFRSRSKAERARQIA
jgi:hypothetical protein